MAASHTDSATDAANCGPETDHTLDATEQRWLEMRIEMRHEIATELNDMGTKMRLEISKEVSEMDKKMRLEIAKEVNEMDKKMRLKIAKEVNEMDKKMRLKIAKEVSELRKTTRQEIVDKFKAMLPKSSNGNGDVTMSSRNQETWTSAPLRPKGESLPEITPDLTDTGIIGIVVFPSATVALSNTTRNKM